MVPSVRSGTYIPFRKAVGGLSPFYQVRSGRSATAAVEPGIRQFILVSIFVAAEFLHYFRSKFADGVDHDSDPGLRDDALISLDCDIHFVWIPGCADGSCAEGRGERHDVGSDGLFRVGIGDEVSDERVAKAWAGAGAAAAIIARFPSDDALTERGERILDDIGRLVGADAFGETGESISPVRRGVSHLIVQGEESCLDINAGRGVSLADIQLETLGSIQGDKRGVLGDVGAVEPVDGKLRVDGGWCWLSWCWLHRHTLSFSGRRLRGWR